MTTLQTLAPHIKDLGGGFMVRRLLPSADRRAVGPFVFFDHFGPIDVALRATTTTCARIRTSAWRRVTYLFDGAMMHRDSTGVVQRIEPGAVNWMTAGRGIVHSERTPEGPARPHLPQPRPAALGRRCPRPTRSRRRRSSTRRPRASRGSASSGATVRVVVGAAFGATSPIATARRRWRWCSNSTSAAARRSSCRRSPPERALYARRPPVRDRRREDRRVHDGRRARGRDADARGAARRPGRAGRRRAARPPLHLLELRLQPARAHPRRPRPTGRRSASRAVPGETEFIPLPARRP